MLFKTSFAYPQCYPRSSLLGGLGCQQQGKVSFRKRSRLQEDKNKSRGLTNCLVSESSLHSHSISPDPILIYLGPQLLKVPYNDLLHNFWGGRLDSPCMICEGPFNDGTGAPVRTVSIDCEGQESRSNLARPPLRIHNRHLECIDAAQWTKIVPISHAWHEAVAVANESQRSSNTAIDLVIDTPYRALDAVRRRFGTDVEIWHDYLSVPQWKVKTQQQLLHALPIIFSKPRRAVVHLEDVPTAAIQRIAKTSLGVPAPLETIAHYMRSDWYQRMWVCLECASSKHIYLLSRENAIASHSFRTVEGRMVEHIGSHMRQLDRETFLAECKKLDLDHLSVASLSNIQRIQTKLTLGAVYVIIAGKQCRTYRDRFVAACAFLNIGNSYREVSAELPEDQTQACLWLSRKCLEHGDYTPLLLAPSLAGDEFEVPGARWMKAHEQMSTLTWRLGRLTKAAKNLVILRQGRVMPQLELVGDICKWEYFSFVGDPTVRFASILDWIIATTGTSGYKAATTMPRIYHFHSWKHRKGPLTVQRLETLLEQFLLSSQEHDHEKRVEVTKSIISLLRFPQSISGGSSLLNYTAVMEKRFFADKHALVIVRCPTCCEKSLQRVALWHALKGQARVYRIPGLGFWRSLPNGVGLVMEGTKVIGRMIYGIPSCGCHNLELVEID